MKPTFLSDLQLLKAAALLALCALPAMAADLRPPATVQAGQAFSIPVQGSGGATFYLVGPDIVVKREVKLDSAVQVQAKEVRAAGRYQVILCDSGCTSASFEVKAAQPAHLSFFLHPSRVPVSTPNSIDATAFVFDQYYNLVLAPSTVDFKITPASGAAFSRQVPTKRGVAWLRTDSTRNEGRVQVTAIDGNVQEARVVQQVAAEACGLRVRALPSGKTVTLETDPVRDCSGNALPDGTVVSFTTVDRDGKSTVDTPLKKGIAKTQVSIHGPAQVTVACGVVVGNEVSLSGKL
ncbi:MAG TPA: hypothetical protein VH350_02515 [Candidatus Sulfotelmatobacter sp.]|jgi:hypothetical protein|nr:hypothetical protein [Candidatus Sulfotelmatobacter sp.]